MTGDRSVERRRVRGGTASRSRTTTVALTALALTTAVSTAAAWSTFASAASGVAPTSSAVSVFLAGGSAIVLALLVVVVHATRTAHRVAGPEYRICQSLRRLREGDLAFRVSLRRGDLLGGLADECNQLIEWLNLNPPRGTRTGTDLVDLEAAVDAGEQVGNPGAVEPVQVEGTQVEAEVRP